MTVSAAGSGRFTSVTLHPQVAIRDKDKASLALELHAQAHADCFIAASCNFPVECVPAMTTP